MQLDLLVHPAAQHVKYHVVAINLCHVNMQEPWLETLLVQKKKNKNLPQLREQQQSVTHPAFVTAYTVKIVYFRDVLHKHLFFRGRKAYNSMASDNEFTESVQMSLGENRRTHWSWQQKLHDLYGIYQADGNNEITSKYILAYLLKAKNVKPENGHC
jgi:hypothetical protein